MLYTLGISAIQDLTRQVEELKDQNSLLLKDVKQLKDDNASLKSDNTNFKIAKADAGDINQLKLQLQELRHLMEQNGIRTEK